MYLTWTTQLASARERRTFVNVQSLTHLIFVVAWAFLGFEVLRTLLTKVARLSWRIAGSAAAAVAISYFLGATGPLAWKSAAETESAILPTPASVPQVFACPANAIVASQSGSGFIDTVGVGAAPAGPKLNTFAVPVGTELHLRGWASLKTGPGTTICAIDNGRKVAGPVSYGLYRPDVAAAMGIPADNATGFSITLKPTAGKHIVVVGAVESDGRSIDKIPGTTLMVNAY